MDMSGKDARRMGIMSKIEFWENVNSIIFMNEKVMNLGDERAEEIWLMTYPDGADLEDVKEMALNTEIMKWLHEDYIYIMKHFA